MIENEEKNTIRVIVCRPGERAEVVEIEETLKSMQQVVGGMIEEYVPWKDRVAIVCNEEGKMNRLPLNRMIEDGDGRLRDVIRGPFFLCYAPIESESFESLPPDLEEKYRKKFELPEMFFQSEKGITAVKYEPEPRSPETAQTR